MAKKIISILGVGGYEDAKHYFNGEYVITSKYVQHAIYELYCKGFGENDEFIVFLTYESKEMYWDEKLEVILNKLSKASSFKVKPIVLDYKDKDYTKNLYTSMIDAIDYGDEVTLDITHGFRSYAILISSILDYIKVVKNVKVKNIVYGEYNKELGETKIRELDDLLNIRLWSNYVDVFLKTGNPKYLLELVSEDKKQSFIKNDGNQKVFEQISNLVIHLNSLFGAVAISDTKEIIKKVESLHENFKLQEIKDIKSEFESYPLMSLIGKIRDKIEQLYNENNTILILNIAEFYCLEFGQIQQGYTLLRELIITDAGQRLDLDINDRKIREDNIKMVLHEMGNRGRKEDNSKEYELEASKLNKAYKGKGYELAKAFDTIGQKRNNLNHAGFSQKDGSRYKDYAKLLSETIATMREIYKIS